MLPGVVSFTDTGNIPGSNKRIAHVSGTPGVVLISFEISLTAVQHGGENGHYGQARA
jgi:hypothetical protein